MEAIRTKPIDNVKFFDGIQFVADLLYFDGPLLSLFKDKNGKNCLFYWIDSDTKYNRWVVLNADNDKIIKYLKKEISLYNLISSNSGCYYKVDIDNDLNYNNIALIEKEDFPTVYLPNRQFFFSENDIQESVETVISKLSGFVSPMIYQWNDIYDAAGKIYDTLVKTSQETFNLTNWEFDKEFRPDYKKLFFLFYNKNWAIQRSVHFEYVIKYDSQKKFNLYLELHRESSQSGVKDAIENIFKTNKKIIQSFDIGFGNGLTPNIQKIEMVKDEVSSLITKLNNIMA